MSGAISLHAIFFIPVFGFPFPRKAFLFGDGIFSSPAGGEGELTPRFSYKKKSATLYTPKSLVRGPMSALIVWVVVLRAFLLQWCDNLARPYKTPYDVFENKNTCTFEEVTFSCTPRSVV